MPANIDAQVSFDSVVETIVRSNEASTLWVEFNGLPGGLVEVRDWNGRSLPQKAREATESESVFRFPLSGPGVYEVRVTSERHMAAFGPSTVSINERGTFTVSLH